MLRSNQIENLRCPASGEELEWMPDDYLHDFCEAVRAGILVNRGGDLVTKVPDAVLACPQAGLGYPVNDRIPVLIADQAVSLEQLDCQLSKAEDRDG